MIENKSRSIKNLWIALTFICMIHTQAFADIIVPVQRQDLVDIVVDVDVQYDEVSQLYMYTYSVTSLATSQQEVAAFAVEVDGGIINPQSPEGWAFFPSVFEPLILWGAVKMGPLPPDYIDDNNLSPSPYQIKPGETLGGFSFQSAEGPLTVRFFAQGFAKLPQADSVEDFDAAGIEIPSFSENSAVGGAIGPGLENNLIFFGGRRPSVDGFMGFVGSANRETRLRPVTIIVRFAFNGETVDSSTFKALLNRVDVTSLFKSTGNGTELMAVFPLEGTPLVIGRNVLNTSVNGIVPQTLRQATDDDSFTFFVDN